MVQLIDKAAVVAEIKRISCENPMDNSWYVDTEELLNFINTLEVIDPYEQYIQYPSIEDGIKAHAEVYSFNIESELFNQLTKEQQVLWRKEIEQACISGGDAGVGLARDIRYKENLEVKEVNLEIEQRMRECPYRQVGCTMYDGKILECRGACSWVVDHLKLKQFKAQKGE